VQAPVSFRVNPDVDPKTHPYISTGLKESKFGIAFADAPALYRRAAQLRHVAIRGIDIHIGSQITELAPYREAAQKVLDLVDRLAADGIELSHIDLGGGLGIRYRDETPVSLPEYAAMIEVLFRGRREQLLFEPGRRLVGDAGVLLTRVTYLKPGDPKSFAIVDAAMNDLLRPALYDAWHPVSPVRPRGGTAKSWDIVGPVCESADFLAHDRSLALAEGDLLSIGAAGAYAMAMSSNYNARPRACEVIVDDSDVHLVRRRERIDELFALEFQLP
jgi:diaminopimelate decarboxylase